MLVNKKWIRYLNQIRMYIRNYYVWFFFQLNYHVHFSTKRAMMVSGRFILQSVLPRKTHKIISSYKPHAFTIM